MIETLVEGKGYLSQLGKSVIPSYSPTATIGTITTALLAYQHYLPLITEGTIEPTDTIAMDWTNATPLKCFNDGLNVVGGYI